MGQDLFPPHTQDAQAMQSKMVRMAGPIHQKDRMVQGRRREALASRKAHAYPMANDCSHRRQDNYTMH